MDTEQKILIAPYGKDKNEAAHLPNVTQLKVTKWVDMVRKGKLKKKGIPCLYLQGGVGSGKTRALLAPVVEMLLEIPDLRMLWGRNDFSDLRLSAMETFFEVVPDALIARKSVQEHRFVIGASGDKLPTQIFFRELKDLAGLGSQEFGVIVISEVYEISKRAFETLKMRVRQAKMPTMILMEGNPPNKGHWLDKATNPAHPDYDSDIEMWKVDTRENWENLPKPYRESLMKMPESWKKKYLSGDFGFTPDGQPFYDGYKEDIHNKSLVYDPNRRLIRVWDYGFLHPAVSFHQIDSHGRWKVLREHMGENMTIQSYGEFIKTKCKEWYPKAEYEDYGDPAGNQKNDKSEKTSVQILASMGIFVTSRASTYRDRKEIIERKLSTIIDGLPALMVDKSCTIINDGFLGGYHYPVYKEGQQFNPRRFELPYKDGYYEHLLNTVEYFAVNTFTGAETKVDNREVGVKVVGDMKDIHFDVEDDTDTNHAAYKRTTQGVFT